MKIGLDFDRVLFDTDSFGEFYRENIDNLHHVENPEPVTNGVYDPEKHAELCGVDKKNIWRLLKSSSLERFLFDDIGLLDNFDDHRLVIVTRGHEKFQRMKVEGSGADKFVDDVFVVQSKGKDCIDIDLLVDDSIEELDRVDVPGIHLERPSMDLGDVLEKVKDQNVSELEPGLE